MGTQLLQRAAAATKAEGGALLTALEIRSGKIAIFAALGITVCVRAEDRQTLDGLVPDAQAKAIAPIILVGPKIVAEVLQQQQIAVTIGLDALKHFIKKQLDKNTFFYILRI